MNKDIFLAFLSGGLAVAAFNYFMGIRKEAKQRRLEWKEEQYKVFLENLIGFFEGWPDERKKNFMEELYTHAPLYASSEVIRLADKFLSCFDENSKSSDKSDLYYKKLVIAMRDDMGEWKRDNLETDDINIRKVN